MPEEQPLPESDLRSAHVAGIGAEDLREGDGLFAAGNYRAAVVAYNRAVLAGTDQMPEALYKVAKSFNAMGDSADAGLIYQKILDRYPQSAEARVIYNEHLSSHTVGAPVFVTAGPTSQAYRVLGQVHADTVGKVVVNLADALTRSRLARQLNPEPKASVAEMNESLKATALQLYGSQVSAVINTTYTTGADGDMYADGIAVQFTGQPSPELPNPGLGTSAPVRPASAPTVEERLRKLGGLLRKGLIRRDEYDRKRAAILDEL